MLESVRAYLGQDRVVAVLVGVVMVAVCVLIRKLLQRGTLSSLLTLITKIPGFKLFMKVMFNYHI